jgi:hypothetical protein
MLNLTQFMASELKNIAIYTILAGLVCYRCLISYKIIKNRYAYAIILCPQYIDALKLKMNMIRYRLYNIRLHFINTALFSMTYISAILIQKIVFFKYSHNLLSLDNMQIVDTVFLLGYL